jgi:hypothetical protein
MTIEEETTEQVAEGADEAAYTPPFLRINGTFPLDDDRVEMVTLELNLGGDQPAGEYNLGRPVDSAAARAWILDLATATIREMRTAGKPGIVLSGEALHAVLRGRKPTAADYDGSCGCLPTPAAPAGPGYEDVTFLAHSGSDRWTGGDRKDAP